MMTSELDGLKVLVVEDEFLQALTYKDMLSEAGAEIIGPFLSSSEALEFLGQGGSCDAAILDYALGEGTAVDLQIRLEQRDIPYVVITGYPKVLVRRGETQTIVAKPVSAELLCGLVAAKARRGMAQSH